MDFHIFLSVVYLLARNTRSNEIYSKFQKVKEPRWVKADLNGIISSNAKPPVIIITEEIKVNLD